jgi:hypothetical protein
MSKIIKIEDKCPSWCPFLSVATSDIQLYAHGVAFSISNCDVCNLYPHNDYWKHTMFTKKCHLKVLKYD